MSKKITKTNMRKLRGQLEWAHWLRAKLGSELLAMHFEVKRVKKADITKAMDQAVKDKHAAHIPCVAHRRDRREWLVTIRAEDIPEFCIEILGLISSSNPSKGR